MKLSSGSRDFTRRRRGNGARAHSSWDRGRPARRSCRLRRRARSQDECCVTRHYVHPSPKRGGMGVEGLRVDTGTIFRRARDGVLSALLGSHADSAAKTGLSLGARFVVTLLALAAATLIWMGTTHFMGLVGAASFY